MMLSLDLTDICMTIETHIRLCYRTVDLHHEDVHFLINVIREKISVLYRTEMPSQSPAIPTLA